jgi:translation initiation factor 3 subunit E
VAKHLDKHLVLPLLEFLQTKGCYDDKSILRAKLALLEKTNMIDFAIDIYKLLEGAEEAPASMVAMRQGVLDKMQSLIEQAAPIVQFLSDPQKLASLQPDREYNLALLKANGIGDEQVESLYAFAKLQFDCGNYSAAAEFLYHYRTLTRSEEKAFNALWGKLGAEILMQNWSVALDDLNRLKEGIDTKQFASSLVQLQQRTWLLHWALFIFFNHENGRNLIVDLFMQERYLNAIQTTAPHLLRYLATAVVINKRRTGVQKDLIRVIQMEKHAFSDPVCEFLECLYVSYDFDGAQEHLRECAEVLANDFFLVACKDEFVEAARHLIFETYCRIHHVIDISMLAEKLNMEQEDAERWVVNLIRNAGLDAKIDSQAGTVVMGSKSSTLYEKIIDKTKLLAGRTYQLGGAVIADAKRKAAVS